MVDVVILEKDLNYCKYFINNICETNKNVRISFIANTIEEILTVPCIDVLIANCEFMEQIENYELSYSHIMYISDNVIDSNTKNLIVIPKDKANSISRKLKILSETLSNINLDNLISDEVSFLDYNFSHTGTLCLIETMKLLYKTTTHYFEINLEKEIYPIVAEKFNTTAHSVKGNIIYATSKMLAECDKTKLCKYLGFNISKSPGSKTIMCTILEKIKFKI